MTEFRRNLETLHASLRALRPDVVRVAVASYDPRTHTVNTFACSSCEANPLTHYAVPLKELPALRTIAETGESRVVNDMRVFAARGSEHSRRLLQAGLLSSYTTPIFHRDHLLGFIFFNSKRLDAFDSAAITQLDITAYAISLLLSNERSMLNTLRATMSSAIEVTHARNPETGEHLKRIAAYTRLIAQDVAERFDLSDETIEHLVLFSSLHDVGKISIPDSVLLKPGKLTPKEYRIMQTHPLRGVELIDALINHHALEGLEHIEMLTEVVAGHHECWDGSGYPQGLAGTEIPVAARIIAVADVFDALTSERPYKDQIPCDKALAMIGGMRGTKLDPDCVDAFLSHAEQVRHICQRFREHPGSFCCEL